MSKFVINEIGIIKISFFELRDNTTEVDTVLSNLLTLRAIITIYVSMISIYVITLLKGNTDPSLVMFTKLIAFSTVLSFIEILISCLICGSVHQKSDNIYALLDELTANSLSNNELNEWLMFKDSRKTNFGFTMGGFAPLRKTTLIPVIIVY